MNQSVQHRQILVEMGIDCWVDKRTQTSPISCIDSEYIESSDVVNQPVIDESLDRLHHTELSNDHQHQLADEYLHADGLYSYENEQITASDIDPQIAPDYSDIDDKQVDANVNVKAMGMVNKEGKSDDGDADIARHTSEHHININTNDIDIHALAVESNNPQQQSPAVNQPSIQAFDKAEAVNQSSVRVAPFKIQAIHYQSHHNSWVLIVDITYLSDTTQQLWHNLVQALTNLTERKSKPLKNSRAKTDSSDLSESVTDKTGVFCAGDMPVEQLDFPICEGVDTLDIANATLAGFVFKLTQSKSVKIAGLTQLAEGLADKRFTNLPSLDDMIQNPLTKRQFWQLINS